jgi:hypothetical protein
MRTGSMATGAVASGILLLTGLSPAESIPTFDALGPAPICRGGVMQFATLDRSAVASGEDLDLMEKLGLLEGHLLIGKALLDAGRQQDGLPHFGHPVRELYDYLAPQIAKRGAAPFEADLLALEAQVGRTPRGSETDALFRRAIERVRALRGTIPDEARHAPDFMLEAIGLLMRDIANDYGEAIVRGRIVETIEYHDAMGFLAHAENLLAELRGNPAAAGDPRLALAAKEVASMREAFPSLQPPDKPVKPVSALKTSAYRVKEAALRQ